MELLQPLVFACREDGKPSRDGVLTSRDTNTLMNYHLVSTLNLMFHFFLPVSRYLLEFLFPLLHHPLWSWWGWRSKYFLPSPPHLLGGSDPKWAKPHDWTIMLSQHNQLIRSLHLKVGAGGSYSNKSPDRWTSLSVPALSVSGCEVVCSDLLGHDGNSRFRGLVCWFNECTACFSPSPYRKYRNHYLTYSVSLYRVSTGLGKREIRAMVSKVRITQALVVIRLNNTGARKK
uniref:Uncharacterized protein n=1 Tax=Timema bartmani TaxID=61472 RepID=A0A7R9F3V1_9NEOP|nr:unnamed protein product [Timema bartmani]